MQDAQYPVAAAERMMKVQEIVMRAMSKQITWWQAAEILGVSTRTMRRMRRGWQKVGYDGLFDRRLKRPSPKRVPVQELEKVLALYREQYSDFNVRHFHEKLSEEHGIHYSYSWVKNALQISGLVARRRQRGPHGGGVLVPELTLAKVMPAACRSSIATIMPLAPAYSAIRRLAT